MSADREKPKAKMKYSSCTEYWLDTSEYRFRGEFEAMYRDIDDPWECSRGVESINNRVFLDVLFHGRRYDGILDLGCGLGALSEKIWRRNGGGTVIGCDVSATAVEKACRLHPEIEFNCLNVQTDDLEPLGRFDLVVMSEILWYLLDNLERVFEKVISVLQPDGIVGVHQYFPSDQKYGRDVLDGLAGFDKFIKKMNLKYEYKLVNECEDGVVLLATLKRFGG